MWRWVTRGLVLSFVAVLAAATATAQLPDVVGSVDSPDPNITQSGVILVRGFALALTDISKIDLYVDDALKRSTPV